MSIPGLGIPGLNATPSTSQLTAEPVVAAARVQDLSPETEWRFEAHFSKSITVKLLSGNAELFGTELGPSQYTFRGTKGAIFTWQGCKLEITGETESDYVAEETTMVQYANLHFALENLRMDATGRRPLGPRVLVVGPEDSGKTSLLKILTAYATKSDRHPMVVNVDPKEGVLSVPGSLTATTVASMIDIEEGWGTSPISGPTPMPVKMPLVYHYGCASAEENNKLYKALITRLALATKARMEHDVVVKRSGILIDTPGGLATGKGANYDTIQHIISEFQVNVLLILGSERLFNDLKKRFETNVTVLRLDKSGGCVDRDDGYMKQLRQSQIREYFFGHGNIALAPHTLQVDLPQLSVYKILTSAAGSSAFNAGDADDDDFYEPTAAFGGGAPTASSSASGIFEKVTPSPMMQNSLLAVTFAQPNDSLENLRDAAVMGYVYVAEVDEAKKKIKLLSPVGGAAPRNAMVWGSWPEEVVSLVS